MSTLQIDSHDIQVANIDLLILKEIDGAPGLIFHLRGGEANSCVFPSYEDRETAWEMIRVVLGTEEGFYDCSNSMIFFRLEAVSAISVGENDKDGPYVQMGFRGGLVLRRPFEKKSQRDDDFTALEQLLGDRPHMMQ